MSLRQHCRQPFETSMLEHPHRARALSEDLAHAVRIEPHDNAQEEYLGLVARQAGEVGQRGVKGEARAESAGRS